MNEPGTRKVDYADFADLKKDMTDMKSLMARMVDALGRIAVIEDRQQAMVQSTGKVLDRIEQIAEKQHQHEVMNAAGASLRTMVDRNTSDINALSDTLQTAQASFKTTIFIGRAAWLVVAGMGAAIWVINALLNAPVR